MKVTQVPTRAAAATNGRYGIAYYRVSTIEQANTSYDDDGFSIQAQRDYCQRKAAELGVQLVDEYVDRGKSARNANRPALQAMLARVKEDLDIQYVFVHKLDRLARNRADDVEIELLLAKNGVQLVSCTENIDDTPSGKLVRGIMADIAEWYSANLSEEAKKGMRKKVENGGTPGRVPIGYTNARLKIVALGKDIGVINVHETYAPVITECFRLYDSGHYTLGDVAAHANAHGLCMPANRSLPERPITTKYMQNILRNRYYTGRVIFAGVEYPGDHQPLIDEATFNRVQALLTARNLYQDKSKKRPHHLKGTLYCARCGRRLGITAPTKRNGATYPYFFCLGRQVDKNSCAQGYIPVGQIEDAVRDYLALVRLPLERIQPLRVAIIDSLTGKQERGKTEITKQQRRITELEQRRRKAKAAYYADVLDLEEFKAEQEIIRRGIAAAEHIIASFTVELESISQALDDAFQLLADPQTLYDTLSEGLKLLLVQALFEKLWVFDEGIVGSELTAPFSELLTLEAQLAWADQRRQISGLDEGATYHRTRSDPLLGVMADSWERPSVERPRGSLAIDEKNLRPQRGKGSNIHILVGRTGLEPVTSSV
jgi:site-specific DNA recombinase